MLTIEWLFRLMVKTGRSRRIDVTGGFRVRGRTAGAQLRRKEVMKMSDPTRRIARWNTKYNTERIKEVIDEIRPTMYANVQSVFPQLTSMETQVKQVLDAEGVATIQYPFYLCYGRELWKLVRKEISGESLAVEAAVLLDKWVARGLAQAALEAVRTQVFNVGAPTP